MTISVAVIGAGRVGATWDSKDSLRAKPATHVGAWKAVGADVTVTDSDMTKAFEAQDALHVAAATTGFVYFNGGFDVVSIATPPETHASVLERILPSKPKLIFCEKPLATTVDDAQMMVDACAKAGIKLATNHTRRWQPIYRKVADVLDQIQDKRGRATGRFTGDSMNVGIHMADLLNWYGFGDNTCDVYQHNESNYLLFELDIIHANGRIRVWHNGAFADVWTSMPSTRYEGINELGSVATLKENERDDTPMLLACRQLVQCVEKGETPYCTGEDGWRALARCINWARKPMPKTPGVM